MSAQSAADTQRLDRWLWFARFFKSRTLAAKLCAGRRVRVNRQIIAKTSNAIKIGDVLTFPQGRTIRVIRVLDLGARRGPATEARLLYEDLSPPELDVKSTPERGAPGRLAGTGRPTKRERRAVDRLKQQQA